MPIHCTSGPSYPHNTCIIYLVCFGVSLLHHVFASTLWICEEKFKDVPIVLLHASYPYSREAGYLASVYPHVYVDFGLAVPLLSVDGMLDAVKMLFEYAPTSKILYSTDAHSIPELYYLAAKWGRTILAKVLQKCIDNSTKQELLMV